MRLHVSVTFDLVCKGEGGKGVRGCVKHDPLSSVQLHQLGCSLVQPELHGINDPSVNLRYVLTIRNIIIIIS